MDNKDIYRKIKGANISKKLISRREKNLIVMETYFMSEIDIDKYCRANGIYFEKVKEWCSRYIAAKDRRKS